LLSLRDFRCDDGRRSACRSGAADNGGLEKIAPIESRTFNGRVFHARLPARRGRSPGHIFVKHAAFESIRQGAIAQGRTICGA
jgi:hypothetical protein